MGRNGTGIADYANQRVIQVNKSPTDKQHIYTANNLEALDEASKNIQSIGGYKLYIYIAKNQNKYVFALSKVDFMKWSGLGKKAYTTGFYELVDKGYLIQDEVYPTKYKFYDTPQNKEKSKIDNVIITYADYEF